MRLANLPISKRYFFFKSKQILPYAIIMAVVGVVTTFIMNLSISSSYSYKMTYIINDYQLLFPGYVFMYVYPILFALFLFSFLHKKNASDLFSAAPITKREYYLTNFIISAIYFAAMILIMMLVSILTVNLLDTSGIPQKIAFGAFVKIFLFLFLGYMQIYTITATAATLTGTIPAQLFTAAAMLLVPTGLLMVFQFPNIMTIDTSFTAELGVGGAYLRLSGEPTNSLIFPINIGTSPLSILFVNAMNSSFTDAYGLMTHFTDTPAMLYTAAIIIFYAILGSEVFSKYKMENVERPFINENFGLAVRASIFLPIITFCVMIFHNDSSVFNTLFITLFFIITVAYIVADLILRKGIKGLGKSLGTYGLVVIASLVCGITLGFIGEEHNSAENDILIKQDSITKLTIYMKPINTTLYSEENAKKYYIPITITDQELIDSFINDSDKNVSTDYSTVSLWSDVYADGEKYFARLRLSGAGLENFYEYIDNTPEVKKSLIIHGGLSKNIKNDVVLAYVENQVRENKMYMTTLNNLSEIKELRTDYENNLLETPIQEIYSLKFLNDAFIHSYSMASESVRFGDVNTEMMMANIKYHDGMYYLSATVIPQESEEFARIFQSFNKVNEKLAVKHNGADYAPIGTINLSDKQIINLKNVLWDIPQLFNKEFRETVLNSLDKEIILENSVIFAVRDNGKSGFFILNYERDIEPFIEKYADYICSKLATKDGTLLYGPLQYGDLILTNIKPSNHHEADAEIKANLPKIKELILTKYTKETLPLELFYGEYLYFEADSDNNRNRYGINFILDGSFTKTLDVYLKEKESCENIMQISLEKYRFNTEEEIVITEKSGEIFEMLKQSVLFDKLLQYSRGDLYYEKYEYPVVYESSSYSIVSTYEVYGGIDYYSYERTAGAYVKYANGDEEYVELRLGSLAYDKLTEYILG